ncbi:hypothetical protein H310_11288 [Aphanomyces invadans]|uniref:Serine protease n=1 Tax=Aphanomyces invadans TaxID=157072 RepID=A0A024TN44_9STRA|nr:hypothetical protein H310_11288 [Aphanomyces invadans]ETV95413.1 hypothetical protein H310_11288 [Aphanomyces invadans]|eukprot:XP_008876114.1 hypothetical protein H310_11288 [Aphanomyces invadans]
MKIDGWSSTCPIHLLIDFSSVETKIEEMSFIFSSWFALLCALATGRASLKHPDSAMALTPVDVGMTCSQYPRAPRVVTFIVDQPGADMVVLHFDHVQLRPGDSLSILAATNHTVGTVVDTLTSKTTSSPLYSVPVDASTVVLELHVNGGAESADGCFGFHVDGVRTSAIETSAASVGESICGTDDAVNAQCFANTTKYVASKPVARLLTHRPFGSLFCTGWLLGCGGHLVTNEHCIQSAADAANTTFEFMAEGPSCTANCSFQGSCKASPRQWIRGATFVAASKDLDYALVKLDPAVIPPGLGYLQLRASGPKLNETVYIPQHPRGRGKQVAAMHGTTPGVITSLTLSGCAPNQAGYMLDTQPGSSGSPVISAVDNTVVALHHCGGCPNAGIQSQWIVQDMVKRGIMPPCGVA